MDNWLSDLPDDIVFEILQFLDLGTLRNCLPVCSLWYNTLTSSFRGNDIWFNHFKDVVPPDSKNILLGDYKRYRKSNDHWILRLKELGQFKNNLSRKWKTSFECGDENQLCAVAVAPNEKYFVTCANDGEVIIWDIPSISEPTGGVEPDTLQLVVRKRFAFSQIFFVISFNSDCSMVLLHRQMVGRTVNEFTMINLAHNRVFSHKPEFPSPFLWANTRNKVIGKRILLENCDHESYSSTHNRRMGIVHNYRTLAYRLPVSENEVLNAQQKERNRLGAPVWVIYSFYPLHNLKFSADFSMATFFTVKVMKGCVQRNIRKCRKSELMFDMQRLYIVDTSKFAHRLKAPDSSPLSPTSTIVIRFPSLVNCDFFDFSDELRKVSPRDYSLVPKSKSPPSLSPSQSQGQGGGDSELQLLVEYVDINHINNINIGTLLIKAYDVKTRKLQWSHEVRTPRWYRVKMAVSGLTKNRNNAYIICEVIEPSASGSGSGLIPAGRRRCAMIYGLRYGCFVGKVRGEMGRIVCGGEGRGAPFVIALTNFGREQEIAIFG